jgi:hypothetical protein
VLRRLPTFASLLLIVVAIGAVVGAVVTGDDVPDVEPQTIPTPPPAAVPEAEQIEPIEDPFSYDPERRREFEARAAAGNAHALYAFSPGGASATAVRVARWRGQVEAAAAEAGVKADLVEALVFLESAGREDAMAGDTESAVGLTQILAETGQNLLGMKVDVARSARYTRQIGRALRKGNLLRVQRLRAARARVDERYDPAKALAGTARYLTMARERFDGSSELALVSYHMGMGNLETVLSEYAGGERVPYAQVYFDSSPVRNPRTHAKLASLGDDSSNYLWKLHAAREIMRLHRTAPDELARIEALQTAKNSAEELLHPAGSERQFVTRRQLRAAWDGGDILGLVDDPAKTGLRVDRRMGELVPPANRVLYRGLRPPALAMALYIGAQTRAMAGDPKSTLTITSTVRDQEYQRRLIGRNPEATRNYSLHTTGWSMDILRRYRSKRHALAFQFVLDRLRSLNLIAWVREPAAIHLTVSRDAEALMPLLKLIR